MTDKRTTDQTPNDMSRDDIRLGSLGAITDDLFQRLHVYLETLERRLHRAFTSSRSRRDYPPAANLCDRLVATHAKLKGTILHPDPIISGIIYSSLLLEAVESRCPVEALDRIDQENLDVLTCKVSLVRFLQKWGSPASSTAALAEEIDQFMKHLQRHREEIIRTGVGPGHFEACPWLGAHLANLYPTPHPTEAQGVRRARKTAAPGKRCFLHDVLLQVVGLRGCCPEEVAGCNCPPGSPSSMLTDEERRRIENGREKLFAVKVKILGHLRDALHQSDSTSIWPRCLAALTDELLADDAEFYFRMDRAFADHDIRTPGLFLLSPSKASGGLTALLQVVRHCEQEIVQGLNMRIGEALRDLAGLLPLGEGDHPGGGVSYFDLLDSPSERAVTAVAALVQACSRLWVRYAEDFRKRVNEAMEREFYEEVVIRRKVRRKFLHQFEPDVSAYANFVSVRLESGGPLPQLSVGDATRNTPTHRYTFRRVGDYWEVGDDKAPPRLVQDSKGMGYIAILLSRPGKSIPARELAVLLEKPVPLSRSDPEDEQEQKLDREAKEKHFFDEGLFVDKRGGIGLGYTESDLKTMQANLLTLEAQLADSRSKGELGRAEELERDIKELKAEIARAGPKGRRRQQEGTLLEKARRSVGKCIRTALEHITRVHPAIGLHLDRSIQRGQKCNYAPSPAPNWQF